MSEDKASASAKDAPQKNKDKSLIAGTTLVLLIILVTLGWYLAADRYTPYTQQARVQAFVVGVAPKVAGIITKVWVHNDQFVEKDTPLFQIDRQSYEIALLAAKDVYMASFVRLSLFFFVTLYAWWTVALLDAWRHRRLRRKHRLTEEPA